MRELLNFGRVLRGFSGWVGVGAGRKTPPPWTGVEELTSDFFRGEAETGEICETFFRELGTL